jgi:hypothetical protein
MSMSWREVSVIDQREEFAKLALMAGANRHELCRRFGISRSNGYKWLSRYVAEGRAGLADRSRRPHRSPNRAAPAVEAAVLRAVIVAGGDPIALGLVASLNRPDANVTGGISPGRIR